MSTNITATTEQRIVRDKWMRLLMEQVYQAPDSINDKRIKFKPELVLAMYCGSCDYKLQDHDEYCGWHWDGAADAAHEFAEWTNHCPKCDARIDSIEDDEEEDV